MSSFSLEVHRTMMEPVSNLLKFDTGSFFASSEQNFLSSSSERSVFVCVVDGERKSGPEATRVPKIRSTDKEFFNDASTGQSRPCDRRKQRYRQSDCRPLCCRRSTCCRQLSAR